jgi:Tol biopolymer transport system component/predicted Ser/Thr protein kinase/flagellar basal body-associated protein FliL
MSLTDGIILENRYQIEHLLSQGGMGAIYRGRDTKLKKLVAVKENFFQTSQGTEQFEQEALILARLHHPNLPRVTDHFSFNDQQYLVMDYIDGEDLWTMVEQRGSPLDEAQALDYILQVCDAISYLHDQDPPIIHRDVKPQNIKVTSKGKAILVDFGIAKVSDNENEYTRTGARGVTPGFSPPEQYSVGGTTKTSDIYALGATLYSILTGVKPPDSISLITGKARLVSPETINSKLSAEMAYVVKWAMQASQDTRPQSVSEWQEKLKNIALVSKLEDSGATARLTTKEILARSNFATKTQMMGETPAHPPEEHSPNRSSTSWIGLIVMLVALVALVSLVMLFMDGQKQGQENKQDTETMLQMFAATVTAQAKVDGDKEPEVDFAATLVVMAVEATNQAQTKGNELTEAEKQATIDTAVEATTQAMAPTATSVPPTNTPTITPTSTLTPSTSTPTITPTVEIVSAPTTKNDKILFQTNRDDNWEIYTVNLDGTELTNLTNHPGTDLNPDWSPNNQYIVFSTFRGDGTGLRVMAVDSHEIIKRITEVDGHRNSRWSPNGKYIAFDAGPRIDIASMDDTPGWKLAQASTRGEGDNYPAWSPDGTKIIFDTEHSASNYDLFVTSSDGSEVAVNLTETWGVNERQPDWSPNGEKIAFVSDEVNGIQQIFIMNSNGSNRQQLTFSDDNQPRHNSRPAWSPDGMKIAFVSIRDGNNEIYVMDSDGSNQINVTNHPADDQSPSWLSGD